MVGECYEGGGQGKGLVFTILDRPADRIMNHKTTRLFTSTNGFPLGKTYLGSIQAGWRRGNLRRESIGVVVMRTRNPKPCGASFLAGLGVGVDIICLSGRDEAQTVPVHENPQVVFNPLHLKLHPPHPPL